MSEKADEVVANITNDKKVEVNETVNKKLSTMSKEAKTRKKRKPQKPPQESRSNSTTISNNQMYMLLAVAGVIIAAASLYYQRKSVVKDEPKKTEQVPVVKVVEPTDDNTGIYMYILKCRM